MSKALLAGAAALILSAGSVCAQTPAAPATTGATAMTASAPAKGLSLDTPIEQIAADPAGKAVLDADLPGLTTHPSYEDFKAMSLKEVQPMSEGVLTDAMLAKTGADLSALGSK
ncbi:MAG: hypothetical protein WA840_01260 [Caulobacteraceae bacterium]